MFWVRIVWVTRKFFLGFRYTLFAREINIIFNQLFLVSHIEKDKQRNEIHTELCNFGQSGKMFMKNAIILENLQLKVQVSLFRMKKASMSRS